MLKYINPEKVTSPKDFVRIIKVLYDGGVNSYSIARLEWEKKPCIGIRWNVSRREYNDKNKISGTRNCVGMPNSRGYPVWFILPTEFNVFIETMLKEL